LIWHNQENLFSFSPLVFYPLVFQRSSFFYLEDFSIETKNWL
jgi:hypothetical protein